MLLRLISKNGAKYFLCPNGTLKMADRESLNMLLTNFDNQLLFEGKDGYWNEEYNMENYPGTTLAYITEKNELVVLDKTLYTYNTCNYLSAADFAIKCNKSWASVKKMCKLGKIEGAFLTSAGWIIPADSEYPKSSPGRKKASTF